MNRIAYGCLLGLGGWLIAGMAIAFYLRRMGVASDASIGAAVFLGLFIWAGFGLLYSALRGLREWWALRAALAGGEPVDGAGAVLLGTLQPRAACLQAPFDGEDCVAYAYKVQLDSGSGRRRTITTCFEGVGLAPCTIATAVGYFRLLTVAELDAGTTSITNLQRAEVERYVRATTFQPRTQSANELLRRWDDADGNYRSDIAAVSPERVDWARCTFSLQVVRPDSPVCVIGYFSAAQRAFVVPPAWAAATRILGGRPDAVALAIAATARSRLLWGFVLFGAVLAAVWAIARNS